MEFSLIEYVGSVGGVGAVFGIVMFLVYRQTVKQIRVDRKFMEDRLTDIIKEYNDVCHELITWLKSKNGSK